MSAKYSKYKQSLLDSTAPDLTTAAVKLVLIDSADYTIDLTLHDFLDDIPALGRVAISGALTGKTITDGVFAAADLAPAFATVTGDPSEYVAMFVDSGLVGTSPLLAIWDVATGLPVTPNGGDINVTFDNGPDKIFRI